MQRIKISRILMLQIKPVVKLKSLREKPTILELYRLPYFRGVPISNYFSFQPADISIRYRLLQTYNKT